MEDVQQEGEIIVDHLQNVVDLEDISHAATGLRSPISIQSEGSNLYDISTESDVLYGDRLGLRNDQSLRIGHININSIPELKDDEKNIRIRQAINECGFQIVGLSEVNRCWHLLDDDHRWRQRTRGWWEALNTSIAYNIKDGNLATPFQPGGTMVLSCNTSAHRVLETGCDTTGLSRWSWTRYRGRHDVVLQVISAYRPCVPTEPGDNTVHAQHLRYLDAHNDMRTPRQAVLEDLRLHIQSSQENGDQIILLMDCNEDIRNATIQSWLQELTLTDAVLTSHGGASAPNTYNRGSKPIDGIFCSSTIDIQACGYLPFSSFPSDHRAVWIDVTYTSAFGYNIPRCIQPKARRLQCKDPRIVAKWVQAYEDFIRSHNLHIRQYALESNASTPLTEADALEYENILAIRAQALEYADKKCRKLKMGGVPFSPEFKKLSAHISLWEAVVKKKSGMVFSMSKLRRLESATEVTNSLHVSLDTARSNLTLAKKRYKEFKVTAKESRKSYLWKLAEAVAQDKDTTTYSSYKQLITAEEQRDASRKYDLPLVKQKKGVLRKLKFRKRMAPQQKFYIKAELSKPA